VAIGGAALYVLKGFPAEETEAAWAFVRFLLEPKTQAKWHIATGYFPVVKGVDGLPEVRQAHVKNPNLTTAIRQLSTSKVNNISAGCLMGSFPRDPPARGRGLGGGPAGQARQGGPGRGQGRPGPGQVQRQRGAVGPFGTPAVARATAGYLSAPPRLLPGGGPRKGLPKP
jgi:hypothetical protein